MCQKVSQNKLYCLTTSPVLLSLVWLTITHPQVSSVSPHVIVNGVKLKMEVDSGAGVSIISKTSFLSNFPSLSTVPCTIDLATLSGPLTNVCQAMVCHVRSGAILYVTVSCYRWSPASLSPAGTAVVRCSIA